MKPSWSTAWQGQDIAVYRNEVEVGRLHAPQIQRVVFVHHGAGDSPGDLVRAVVELDDDCAIFSAETGFAGRVNFERQAFWAERACVYWVSDSKAHLPWRMRHGIWFLRAAAPAFARLPKAELGALIEQWPLQGPQTWEQRKWRRIQRFRPLAALNEARLTA
jgi:hypothetical protein